MRERAFMDYLRNEFNLLHDDHGFARARILATAMHEASDKGASAFNIGGQGYKITQEWYDGCISGNCNPATCYTSWSLDKVGSDS